MTIHVTRLTAGDAELATNTVSVMAQVFNEGSGAPRGHIQKLLAEDSFWLLAAIEEDRLVGGLTAHALPMTKEPGRELFIYDLAVSPSHQRQGIGRELVLHACKLARAEGISVAFVPADNEDRHALDFYRAIGGQAQPVTFFNFEL